MTVTEKSFVDIKVEARAIALTPNIDPAVKDAADRIAKAADEALNVAVRKPREPKVPKPAGGSHK